MLMLSNRIHLNSSIRRQQLNYQDQSIFNLAQQVLVCHMNSISDFQPPYLLSSYRIQQFKENITQPSQLLLKAVQLDPVAVTIIIILALLIYKTIQLLLSSLSRIAKNKKMPQPKVDQAPTFPHKQTSPRPLQDQQDNDQDNVPTRTGPLCRVRGLANLGNTCYFSSALQCLHKAYEIEECLKGGKNQPLSKAYLELVSSLSEGGNSPIRPIKMKQLVGGYNFLFSDYSQQDAGEAISTILRMLHEEQNEVKTKGEHKVDPRLRTDPKQCQLLWTEEMKREQLREKSKVSDLLFGHFRTEYQCLTCRQYYILFEKFSFLYLPLPSHDGSLTLGSCFAQFAEKQTMRGTNAMYCENCSSFQSQSKRMAPYKLPPVLLICFKRYIDGSKDQREVSVPRRLSSKDISTEVKESCTYQLFGIVEHWGRTLLSGHYTATCCDQQNGWVNYNDETLRRVTEQQAMKSARSSYILCYRRK